MAYRTDEARSHIERIAASGNRRALWELLPYLPPNAHPNGHDAAMVVDQLLRSASPLELAQIDAWFRSGQHSHPVTAAFDNIVIGGFAWDPVQYRGLVALCTMHWNGRVRDAAVAAIAVKDDAFTIPLLLIRLNDWVEQVHHRAATVLEARVDASLAERWIAALPLLDRVATEMRRSGAIGSLANRVDAMLVSSEARTSLLLAAFHSTDPRVRRTAFMRARHITAPEVVTLIARAAAEGDMIIAAEASKTLFGTATQRGPANVGLALTIFKKQTNGALRARALEHAFRIGPDEAASTIREAIFDNARVVRELARYALEKREGVTAADCAKLYRARLATEGARCHPATAEGLAEVASAADLDVSRAMLDDPRARVRAAGWVGIGRADPNLTISDVERALADPSRDVRKAIRPFARRLLGKGVGLEKRSL